jgi:hypothetical protein
MHTRPENYGQLLLPTAGKLRMIADEKSEALPQRHREEEKKERLI